MRLTRELCVIALLVLLVSDALAAGAFVVYTTAHFAGENGLSRYYRDTFTRAKNTPEFKRQYPHLARARLVFRGFTHGGHIRRLLTSTFHADAVLGLLDYEVDELQRTNRPFDITRVIAESPLTIMMNTKNRTHYRHMQDVCASGHTLVVPHTGLSVQGRDMYTHIDAVCGRSVRLRFVNSWGSAYAQFLHEKAAFVVSYAASSLFHRSSSRYRATYFQPIIFEEGHIFHRYTVSLVKKSAIGKEFMRFITHPRHHTAIQQKFYMYPPNKSPKAFRENHTLTRIVQENFQKHHRTSALFPVKKYVYLVVLTGLFALVCAGVIVLISIGIGILDLCATLRMRRVLVGALVSALAIPQVLTIPLLLRAWQYPRGWEWVFAYEVWFGVAFISIVLIASNREFPETLLTQVRQLRLGFLQFVRYVYVPHIIQSHTLLFYTLPAVLFGTCGSFMFAAPMATPSVNMFLLEQTQQGATWVLNPLAILPHIVIAGQVTRISQTTRIARKHAHTMRLIPRDFVGLGIVSVGVFYLWPFLGNALDICSKSTPTWGFSFSQQLFASGAYSLGVAFLATCLATLVYGGIVSVVIQSQRSIRYMLGVSVFGLIVPRFIWIIGYENPQTVFFLGQSGFALALLMWLNAARVKQMQVTYSPLLAMHTLGCYDRIRGIIRPELGGLLAQTAVLTCVCVLNEFVMASAYPMTQPRTLPRFIYLSLENYHYADAFTGSVLLLALNALLFGVYASFNQEKKIR